ncbi:Detected protein of unknown function [Hibiscus syriacus]|uniref:Cytochrome P450 n=1 Tax=Hibiscus syriacus TaxID=106335 RepID=A0A6A3AUM6_HIBSY|nr:Detected protein of unknown function [Hibiscus syriacus]
MMPELLLNIHRVHDWCTKTLERCRGTCVLEGPWFANMIMVITCDPANIHYILSSNFSNFPKGPEYKKIFDILGDGIVNVDMDLWKKQRVIAQASIKHHLFHKYLLRTTRAKVENGLIPVIEHAAKQGLVMNLEDIFQRFTLDSVCILVTGYDPSCLALESPRVLFSEVVDDATEAIFYRHVRPECFIKLQKWLNMGQERQYRKAWEVLDDIMAKEGHIRFCSHLIIWLVSRHPIVENKIIEELQSRISVEETQKRRFFDVEEVKDLVYLHEALCEALRMYPPIPFNHKEPLEPDVLPSGHPVHPNMKILFNLYSMGRMKSVWGEDCLEFKPERWINERGEIKRPRACLGKEMAIVLMKAVVSSIVYNYRIHVSEETPVVPAISIILHTKDGLMTRISTRWD